MGTQFALETQPFALEVAGFYRIIPLTPFRRTSGVTFDMVPIEALPRIDAIDRVIYERNAASPGPVGDVVRPWYMHPAQDDHVVVLHGSRKVDLYQPQIGRIETFIVTPHEILHNNQVIFDGGAILSWSSGVFHRIMSDEHGSASLNFAVRYPGYDAQKLYDVYDLDTRTGDYRVIREGWADLH